MIRTTMTTNEARASYLPHLRLPVLLAVLVLLSGCQTTGTGTAVECGAFRRITYSASKDRAKTVTQIRVHNKTMDNLRCPR